MVLVYVVQHVAMIHIFLTVGNNAAQLLTFVRLLHILLQYCINILDV